MYADLMRTPCFQTALNQGGKRVTFEFGAAPSEGLNDPLANIGRQAAVVRDDEIPQGDRLGLFRRQFSVPLCHWDTGLDVASRVARRPCAAGLQTRIL